jgi:hypothetical protein
VLREIQYDYDPGPGGLHFDADPSPSRRPGQTTADGHCEPSPTLTGQTDWVPSAREGGPPWMEGYCGTYAHALRQLRPDLRIGVIGEPMRLTPSCLSRTTT